MKAKRRLEQYLRTRTHRICASAIFLRLTKQCTGGKIAEVKRRIGEGKVDHLDEGIKYIRERILEKREFMAYLIPTVISKERGRSFLFSNEKEPTEEDVYYWLYLILSGIYGASGKAFYIVNLLDAADEAKSRFLDHLINEGTIVLKRPEEAKRGINMHKLSEICRGTLPFSGEHVFTFACLNYFMYFCKQRMRSPPQKLEGLIDKWGTPKLLEEWGITDKTALLTIEIPTRGKKSKMYFFPEMGKFARRWYSDFFSTREIEYPQLGRFVASLYVMDKRYRDLSANLLNKFLFYLLRGEVNGELLEKLVRLKAIYALETGRPATISQASYFYSKLTG